MAESTSSWLTRDRKLVWLTILKAWNEGHNKWLSKDIDWRIELARDRLKPVSNFVFLSEKTDFSFWILWMRAIRSSWFTGRIYTSLWICDLTCDWLWSSSGTTERKRSVESIGWNWERNWEGGNQYVLSWGMNLDKMSYVSGIPKYLTSFWSIIPI